MGYGDENWINGSTKTKLVSRYTFLLLVEEQYYGSDPRRCVSITLQGFYVLKALDEVHEESKIYHCLKLTLTWSHKKTWSIKLELHLVIDARGFLLL